MTRIPVANGGLKTTIPTTIRSRRCCGETMQMRKRKKKKKEEEKEEEARSIASDMD